MSKLKSAALFLAAISAVALVWYLAYRHVFPIAPQLYSIVGLLSL